MSVGSCSEYYEPEPNYDYQPNGDYFVAVAPAVEPQPEVFVPPILSMVPLPEIEPEPLPEPPKKERAPKAKSAEKLPAMRLPLDNVIPLPVAYQTDVPPQPRLPLDMEIEALPADEARERLIFVTEVMELLRKWLDGGSLTGVNRYVWELLQTMKKLQKRLRSAAKV